MFREMRRKDKLMEHMQVEKIMEDGSYGTLSVIGDSGYPYAVPLNFVYHENAIYFHSATNGHKIDAISADSKVCFTIVDSETIIPEDLNTHFKSVVVFGRASLLDGEEKLKFLKLLGMKYSGMYEAVVDQGISRELNRTAMIKLQIEHVEGKVSK